MSNRDLPLPRWIRLVVAIRPAAPTAAIIALGVLAIAPLPAAEPTRAASPRPTRSPQTDARSRTVVDHAVQPAGGAACRECGPGGCQHRQPAHGHHRNCRDGACVPYCPVRPGTFGFYGTQWRRWPGQGVVPVSNEEAATPVVPPKSEVPDADEESMGPAASELPEPEMPAASGRDMNRGGNALDTPFPPEPDAAIPAEPMTEQEPAAAQQPTAPEPREVPQANEAKPAQPEAAKPAQPEAAPAKPRPADENLFDDSAALKIRRKIPVANGAQPLRREPASRVQPANHEGDEISRDRGPAAAVRPATSAPPARAAKPRTVPRVPFDPRAETARMQQGRPFVR
jgi:hypothetical protein